MKKVTLFLIIILLLLTGCSNVNEAIYNEAIKEGVTSESLPENKEEEEVNKDEEVMKKSEESEETKDLEGTLKAVTMRDFGLLYTAEKFMEKYPKVKIEVEGKTISELELMFAYDTEEEEKNNYATKLAAEIMSGDAPDIIDISFLDRNKYYKSGYFTDIYQLMESDEDFNKEEYFTNIFKAMEYKNKLYTLPTTFSVNMVFLNEDAYKALNLPLPSEKITLDEMYRTYNLAKTNLDLKEDFYISYYPKKESRLEYNKYKLSEYIDLENNTHSFDSEEFVEYIEMIKNLPINDNFLNTQFRGEYSGGYYSTNLFDGFMYINEYGYNYDLDYQLLEEIEYRNNIPISNSDGEIFFDIQFSCYSISENSDEKDLAWEFLKFKIEEKEEWEINLDSYDLTKVRDIQREAYEKYNINPYPININNVNYLQKINLASLDYKIYNVPKKDLSLEEKKDILTKHTDETLERLKNVSVVSLNLVGLNNHINETLLEYYSSDLYTAEEVSLIISDKINLYLNE